MRRPRLLALPGICSYQKAEPNSERPAMIWADQGAKGRQTTSIESMNRTMYTPLAYVRARPPRSRGCNKTRAPQRRKFDPRGRRAIEPYVSLHSYPGGMCELIALWIARMAST